jgi:hypothetical protein
LRWAAGALVLSQQAIKDPDGTGMSSGPARGQCERAAQDGSAHRPDRRAAADRGRANGDAWLLARGLSPGKPAHLDYWNGHIWTRRTIPHWTGRTWAATDPAGPTASCELSLRAVVSANMAHDLRAVEIAFKRLLAVLSF